MSGVIKGVNYFCKYFNSENEVLAEVDRYPKDWHEVRLAAACVLMACADDANTGPVQVGIVGGELMEFEKQRGVTQIPF